MSGSMHDGHRDRMRERVLAGGIEGLQDHEALEYILYAFIPRKDTNPIAHNLISKFGSFKRVLDAPVSELEEVPGMTHNAALFLSTLPQVVRKYIGGDTSKGEKLNNIGDIRRYLGAKFLGLNAEAVYCLALDAHENLISCECLGKGGGNSVELSVRKVVDFATRNKASYIVLAHNHPSGVVSPSYDDFEFTSQLKLVLSGLQIVLGDHLIFAGEKYYSFHDTKELDEMSSFSTYSKEGMKFYV